MIIVSDTTTLTYLSRIGLLDLLPGVVGAPVLVPPAVWDELILRRPEMPGVAELRAQPWLQVHPLPPSTPLESELEAQLDRGEAEAIQLAEVLGADVLVMDERKGRRVAEERGLKVVGLIGILVGAKKVGLIPSVRGVLSSLIGCGFRAHPSLIARALRLVDED